MKVVGDKSTFAFEIGEFKVESSDWYEVNIYIGSKNICHVDNHPYLPQFICDLECDADYFKKKIDWIKFEQHFIGLNAMEAHQLLMNIGEDDFDSQEFEDAMYEFHRVLKWSPTTDNVCCFLIPIWGVLCLTCELWQHVPPEAKGIVYGAEVTPYQLITTIESAIDILKTKM